jgi:hypothetical protein
MQFDHEIVGAGLASFITSIGISERFFPMIQKYDTIASDEWYPAQDILKVMSELAAQPGSVVHLVNMGMNFSQTVGALSQLTDKSSVQAIMDEFEAWYRLSQRGTTVGKIHVEHFTDKSVRVVLQTPFPDDLCYGIVYGYIQRFAPKGTLFRVWYDPKVRHRDLGGETTVICVSWR